MIPMMLTGEVSCGLDERPVVLEAPTYKGVLKGLNILAAEDNDLNRELLSEILADQAAKVIIEPDGRKLVDRFLNEPENTYDLILMDIMMPDVDGYEATRLIRNSKREGDKTIPIIAMTGNAFEEDINKSKEAGMNAHLSKPVKASVLTETILKYI